MTSNPPPACPAPPAPRQSIPARAWRRFVWVTGRRVLGTHPYNTVFSFNFLNVRHIVRFLRDVGRSLPAGDYEVADVGGGACPYYPLFAGRAAGYTVVDLPESLPANDSRPIRQLQGFAEALPLEDASVDLVLCNQVLEHVRDAGRTVGEAHRVLRPGGWYVGSVPHVSPVHLEPYDYRRFTDLGLRQALAGAGFTDVRIEGNTGAFGAAALLLAMDWVLSRRREGTPQSLSPGRALLLSPLIGGLNAAAWLLDKMLGDSGRTPANLCWTARKPPAYTLPTRESI